VLEDKGEDGEDAAKNVARHDEERNAEVRSTRGSRRTGISRWTGVGWEWKERKGYGRGATKIGAMSRMPKNYMPALPAEVPRLYHARGR